MYLFLLVLTGCSTFGFQGWTTLFNNYAVEVVGFDGRQMGIAQGLRELPGLLALLVIYLLFLFKEHRLAALSVLVLGLGIGLTGFTTTFTTLVLATVVMSFGFHYFETLNQSLTLQYFDKGTAPVVFGRLRSLSAGVSILAGGAIFLLDRVLEYRTMFLGLAGVVVLGAIWCFMRDPTEKEIPIQQRRMVLKTRYWLYYALTFMAGARRQIFTAFAVFLLVKKFGYSVGEIALLFTLNNLVNYFLSPAIGYAINRLGERRILSIEYLALVFIFIGYALTESRITAAVLYILDHIFYNFAMAIRTYFQKIADPGDIAPSMAVGFTINHLVAVAIPVLGGFLWMVDYRIPFLAGAGMSVVSLALVQFIRIEEDKQ
jgi:predicted MFS family arabinose efflux permease